MNTEPSTNSISPNSSAKELQKLDADDVTHRAQAIRANKIYQDKVNKLVAAYQKRDDLSVRIEKLNQEAKELNDAITLAETAGDYGKL